MLLTLTHFSANRLTFFLGNEYINFDKKSYGPLVRAHISSLVTQTLAKNRLHVNLTSKLKR